MLFFRNRSARKEIVLNIENAQRRISNIEEIQTALHTRVEDTCIYIVASSPALGTFAAQLSDHAVNDIKSIVYEDIERKKRSERRDMEYQFNQLELLIVKKPKK